MNCKILFKLLSEENFLTITSDKEFKKLVEFGKPLIGYAEFFTDKEKTKFETLKSEFLKENLAIKVKIIERNPQFAVFLQHNEVFLFLDACSYNGKYFFLTYIENIDEFDFKQMKLTGSIYEIGRLLLLNSHIENRISKIGSLIKKGKSTFLEKSGFSLWSMERALSMKEIIKLFEVSKNESFTNGIEKISQKIEDHDKIQYLQQGIKEYVDFVKGEKEKLIRLLEQRKTGTSVKTIIPIEQIREKLLKTKSPFEGINITKNKPVHRDQYYSFPKFIMFKHSPNVSNSYPPNFLWDLPSNFIHFKEYMNLNYQNYKTELFKKDDFPLSIKRICNFYDYLQKKEFHMAGFIAINGFYKTIEKLFAKEINSFEEKNFGEVCETIKEYMPRDYQDFITLTFCPIYEGQTNPFYFNARHRLMHFNEKFNELHAFAILCLAVENQRIIDAKIPLEKYKDGKIKDINNNRLTSADRLLK